MQNWNLHIPGSTAASRVDEDMIKLEPENEQVMTRRRTRADRHNPWPQHTMKENAELSAQRFWARTLRTVRPIQYSTSADDIVFFHCSRPRAIIEFAAVVRGYCTSVYRGS